MDDLDGPNIAPPAGIEPNFDNPPNENVLAKAVEIIALVLVTIGILARTIARFKARNGINEVDILATLGFFLYVPFAYVNYSLSFSGGYAVHSWNVRRRDVPKFNYVIFVAHAFYIPILTIIKVAILAEWIRIFAPIGTHSFFRRACVVTIAIVTLWGGLALVLLTVNCTPFEANWNVLLTPRYCRYSFFTLIQSSGAINLVLDLVPLVLPQKIIWSLNMSSSKRLGVSLIFAVGLLGVAAALFRLIIAVHHIASADQLYHFSRIELLSFAEITSAFLVLCIPYIPKALASTCLERNFLSLWSSKTRDKATRPSTKAPSPSRRGYKEVDEESAIPLSEFQRKNAKLGETRHGITRVIEFTATTEFNSSAAHEQYRSQHPWVR
ncbi:hypothetical protein NUW58_g1548 [Xylaria curta]|uniref:Uncharacterized protein n=1 Tax=Xylaria curta TaxID=42375 RepID=A0ACC1PJW9_9PEZI|nr:hypothetical protein NUW58_g1548 [Xylaria curta]